MITAMKSLLSHKIIYSFSKTPYINCNILSNHILICSQRFRNTTAIKCWKCGIERQNLHELFCQQCKIIQSPEDKHNYFKLLQHEENFDIDTKELREKYRKMQSILHPDKFSNRSSEEKQISEDFSSLVNKAYDILQSPLRRAVHLLCLNGVKIKEDERIEDPEFLMEIMELNENVENASSGEELKELASSNRKTREKLEQEISKHFKDNNLDEVKNCIIKLRYYNSVSMHINELMREKGIVE